MSVNIGVSPYSEDRDILIKRIENVMCITRKLFCPTAVELADTLIYLSNFPGIKEDIVSGAHIRATEADNILSALKKEGYIEESNGIYRRTGKPV